MLFNVWTFDVDFVFDEEMRRVRPGNNWIPSQWSLLWSGNNQSWIEMNRRFFHWSWRWRWQSHIGTEDETFDCRKKWRDVHLIKLLDMIEQICHNSSTLFDFSVVQWQELHLTKCVTDSLLFMIAASPASIDRIFHIVVKLKSGPESHSNCIRQDGGTMRRVDDQERTFPQWLSGQMQKKRMRSEFCFEFW